jgi:uncharacterized repeat protein (TIGR03803 family)
MTNTPRSRQMLLATVILAVLGFCEASFAQSEKILHGFINRGNDGFGPYDFGGLAMDSAGNLYGTTASGNAGSYYGTVFELSPAPGTGAWSEKILYTFANNGVDGNDPYGGLIFDKAGNLYGTTHAGGSAGFGTVFELSPAAGGGWTEQVLHSFVSDSVDGIYPWSGLVMDASGNLYGTTVEGGTYNYGTIFQLIPQGGGIWTENILHSFNSNGTDGYYSYSALTLDASENLYGATAYGGAFGHGTVFQLKPSTGGRWTEKILHSFNKNGMDGVGPFGGVTLDSQGNLYGTTLEGGASNSCSDGGYYCGTVFKLTPTGSGGWAASILHSFANNGHDGYYPYSSLVFDGSGNLYGTTSTGGAASNDAYGGGIVFELSPQAGGRWSEKVLHSFSNNGTDGAYPQSGMIIDGNGNLYGTTVFGGLGGYGAVFEVTP